MSFCDVFFFLVCVDVFFCVCFFWICLFLCIFFCVFDFFILSLPSNCTPYTPQNPRYTQKSKRLYDKHRSIFVVAAGGGLSTVPSPISSNTPESRNLERRGWIGTADTLSTEYGYGYKHSRYPGPMYRAPYRLTGRLTTRVQSVSPSYW